MQTTTPSDTPSSEAVPLANTPPMEIRETSYGIRIWLPAPDTNTNTNTDERPASCPG